MYFLNSKNNFKTQIVQNIKGFSFLNSDGIMDHIYSLRMSHN